MTAMQLATDRWRMVYILISMMLLRVSLLAGGFPTKKRPKVWKKRPKREPPSMVSTWRQGKTAKFPYKIGVWKFFSNTLLAGGGGVPGQKTTQAGTPCPFLADTTKKGQGPPAVIRAVLEFLAGGNKK